MREGYDTNGGWATHILGELIGDLRRGKDRRLVVPCPGVRIWVVDRECLWFSPLSASAPHSSHTRPINKPNAKFTYLRQMLHPSLMLPEILRGRGSEDARHRCPLFVSGEARSAVTRSRRSGPGRSGNADLVTSAPCAMHSKPRANAQRTLPARTSIAARTRAALTVEQLLFTFVIRMPVRSRC